MAAKDIHFRETARKEILAGVDALSKVLHLCRVARHTEDALIPQPFKLVRPQIVHQSRQDQRYAGYRISTREDSLHVIAKDGTLRGRVRPVEVRDRLAREDPFGDELTRRRTRAQEARKQAANSRNLAACSHLPTSCRAASGGLVHVLELLALLDLREQRRRLCF